jgi:UDP-glucose 4-epimerase
MPGRNGFAARAPDLPPMRVLVTGGAGFIGSHVCDELLAHGHEVLALDNLSSGRRENLDPRVPLTVADIRSPEAAGLVERARPEAICHLAAQIDVRRSVADPRLDADCNISGLLNLLEAARKSGVKKVVFSSTGGAIYGEQDVHPAPETHPQRPLSPYGCSKAAGEIYLTYYRLQYGLPYVALRYANVYGPRQNPHGEAGVVAIFSELLLAGAPCNIYGSGRQRRDFVFVADVARANRLALAAEYCGPLNIGTGRETDIVTVHRLLAELAGVGAAPRHLAAKPGEQQRSSIDASLAAQVLGWQPGVPLREGLEATLEFFRQRRTAERAAA